MRSEILVGRSMASQIRRADIRESVVMSRGNTNHHKVLIRLRGDNFSLALNYRIQCEHLRSSSSL